MATALLVPMSKQCLPSVRHVLPITSNDLNVAAHATCSDGFLQGSIDALGQWHRPLTDAESGLLHDGFELEALAP